MPSLAGIRILDLSRLLPGPYATQLLANLGAEVIKIERPPDGDYARAMPPFVSLDEERVEGALFAANNRGKKSVALNFDDPRGRALLLRLSERADVLVESFRPGAMAARGLDYAAVQAHNPRLVYCALSGYGQTGPYRERAGHDLNYLALAGVLELNGKRNGAPTPPPIQIADLAGGMRAALDIVAALIERTRTGEGKFLDCALFDVAVDWMQTLNGALFRAEGEDPRRGETPLSGAYPCYNIYATSDGGYMALGALEPKFWHTFCRAAARDDLVDAQFDTDAIPRVAALFQTRSRAEWTDFAGRVDCCLEPLLRVSETLAHPQVLARQRSSAPAPAPRLGEHTGEILRELGLSGAELRALARDGVIVGV